MVQLPVFIICHDRLTPLKALISWLEKVGQEEIYLIDNVSTYPELLEYYFHTPHNVIYLHEDQGHHSPWRSGILSRVAKDRFFIVTDPDIVPVEDCPDDAIDYFYRLLLRYENKFKAGFGLRIDDLPDHYKHKQDVIAWETQFWGMPMENNVYQAPIDTTFAVYRPHAGPEIGDSLRTGSPYIARHTTWYINTNNPTDEERYYGEHASHASQWGRDEIPEGIRKKQ